MTGYVELPTGPGWGTEIDEAAVRAHPVSGPMKITHVTTRVLDTLDETPLVAGLPEPAEHVGPRQLLTLELARMTASGDWASRSGTARCRRRSRRRSMRWRR